jgi:hypothetical protein
MHQELYDSHLIKIVRFLCNDDIAFCKKLYHVLRESSELNEIDKTRLKIFHEEISKQQNKKKNVFSFIEKIWR